MGPIGLDPCSLPDNPTGARVWYTKATAPYNRLAIPEPGEVSFVNPPYSEITDWMETLSVVSCGLWEVVALVPARTDTRWWHESVAGKASAICFWKGRLVFDVSCMPGCKHDWQRDKANKKTICWSCCKYKPVSAPFPSAVVYYGPRVEAFRDAFSDAGWIV